MKTTAAPGFPVILPGYPTDDLAPGLSPGTREFDSASGGRWASASRPWRATGWPIRQPRCLFAQYLAGSVPIGNPTPILSAIDGVYVGVLDPGGWSAVGEFGDGESLNTLIGIPGLGAPGSLGGLAIALFGHQLSMVGSGLDPDGTVTDAGLLADAQAAWGEATALLTSLNGYLVQLYDPGPLPLPAFTLKDYMRTVIGPAVDGWAYAEVAYDSTAPYPSYQPLVAPGFAAWLATLPAA